MFWRAILVLLVFLAPLQHGVAKTRVLYLGDSMSMGAFGLTFDKSMRGIGLDVYTLVAGGASPYYWLKRYEPIACHIGYWEKTPHEERRVEFIRAVPKIEDLMRSYSPDIVVVQTGVNLYSTLRSKRRTMAENQQLVTGLVADLCRAVSKSRAKLYWICPPESHPKRYPPELQDMMNKIMTRTVTSYGGKTFNSLNVTHWSLKYPEQSDGIHYGPVEARSWAEKVATDFSYFVSGREPPVVVDARPAEKSVELTPAPAPAEVPILQPQPSFTSEPPPAGSGETSSEIEATMVLREKSEVRHVNEATYGRAFAIYEYEIKKLYRGDYPYKTVRVAHMVVINNRFTGPSRYQVGKQISLALEKIERYPRLEQVQMIDSLPVNLDLPVYICKL